jgi:hypothetical protein
MPMSRGENLLPSLHRLDGRTSRKEASSRRGPPELPHEGKDVPPVSREERIHSPLSSDAGDRRRSSSHGDIDSPTDVSLRPSLPSSLPPSRRPFLQGPCYLPALNGRPNSLRRASASRLVFDVVTIEMSIPRICSILSYSMSGNINCSSTPRL